MILSFTIKERGKGLDTDHFILLSKEPSFTIIKKKKFLIRLEYLTLPSVSLTPNERIS